MSIEMHNGVLHIDLEEATNPDGVKYGKQSKRLMVQPVHDGVVLISKINGSTIQAPIVLGKAELRALTLRLMEVADTHGIRLMLDSVENIAPHLAELDQIDDDLSHHG